MLPGMLQYVGTGGAKKVARTGGLERLDQEESPVRAALNKISSKLIRDVSYIFRALYVFIIKSPSIILYSKMYFFYTILYCV